MGARFTLAGENLIAQKQAAKQTLIASRFILANVPGLNVTGPVDRAAGKPTAAQIAGTYPVTQAGYVNPSQVVYSLMLGSDIGDFDWNWIGLESAEGVLLMVAYVPLQQKRRNIPPQQLGNNVTRNFLLKFDGAQELTGVTIDASTWQHDFTVRLAGIDERERLANRDVFGRACFFGSALQLEKVGSAYQLKPGTAYVEGVRLQGAAPLPVVPPALPTTAWLDVALQRELSDVVASWSVVWGAGKVDYLDSAGVQHYCVPVADLVNTNTITDRRPVENIAGPLVAHFAARVGDYAQLRARATTKDDVGLGNLPNAKSDDENTDSSLILATTKAVKAATAILWTAIANIVSGATTVGKAAKLDTPRTFNLTGDITGNTSFDGSADVTFEVSALQAQKLKIPRLINGVPFDGTGDIVIDGSPPGSVVAFAVNTPPAGWLKANGAAVSRTTYARLFAAIGATFGPGDGSTTFNLPDLRGEFIRGWSDGRTDLDGGRLFGSSQDQLLQGHTHSGNTTLSFLRAGAGGIGGPAAAALTSLGGDSTSGALSGETRPHNVALLACIRY